MTESNKSILISIFKDFLYMLFLLGTMYFIYFIVYNIIMTLHDNSIERIQIISKETKDVIQTAGPEIKEVLKQAYESMF